MNNQLYRRIVKPRAFDQDAGVVVGACVTHEVNGYAVWEIAAAGDGESFEYTLAEFYLYGREDAIDQASAICKSLDQ